MADALARIRAKRAAKASAHLTPLRSCAGCDLCCTAPGISELGKPPGERCSNLCGEAGASCSIYPSRPKVCVEFYCLWRITDAVLPDWLRPADCGFLLGFNNVAVWPGVITVHVDPERPDAWDNPWAKTVFAEIANAWNCLVAIGQSPGTTHIFCPDGTLLDLDAYTPEERLLLSREDGFIGAPDFVFHADKRPLAERMREVRFSWGLAPPPWAQ